MLVSNLEQNWESGAGTPDGSMAANPTLLCIHHDPAQLSVLQENGYDLVTAANGCEGLRLFSSRPVDAIVLEYNLGLLDGSVIASQIKQVRPKIPIVMLAEHADLPDGALHAVDVLVSSSDPPHFLWAAVHFLLTVKPAQHREAKLTEQAAIHPHRLGRPREDGGRPGDASQSAAHEVRIDRKGAPFSPKEWESIRDGIFRF